MGSRPLKRSSQFQAPFLLLFLSKMEVAIEAKILAATKQLAKTPYHGLRKAELVDVANTFSNVPRRTLEEMSRDTLRESMKMLQPKKTKAQRVFASGWKKFTRAALEEEFVKKMPNASWPEVNDLTMTEMRVEMERYEKTAVVEVTELSTTGTPMCPACILPMIVASDRSQPGEIKKYLACPRHPECGCKKELMLPAAAQPMDNGTARSARPLQTGPSASKTRSRGPRASSSCFSFKDQAFSFKDQAEWFHLGTGVDDEMDGEQRRRKAQAPPVDEGLINVNLTQEEMEKLQAERRVEK